MNNILQERKEKNIWNPFVNNQYFKLPTIQHGNPCYMNELCVWCCCSKKSPRSTSHVNNDVEDYPVYTL